MTHEEIMCRKLNKLGELITSMMTKEKDPENLLNKYESLIDELPESAKEAKERYVDIWASLTAKAAMVTRRTVTGLPTSSLPSMTMMKHNGKVESFTACWSMYESLILRRQDISEEEKHARLCIMLSEGDQAAVAGLSLGEIQAFVLKKYRSPEAIRTYIQTKFSSVKVRNADDMDGLMAVIEALQAAIPLVKSSQDQTVELQVLLFNLVYSVLPVSWARPFWKEHNDRLGCPVRLLSFLESHKANILADRVARLSVGQHRIVEERSQRVSSSSGICFYCKDVSNPHLVANCPRLVDVVCRSCSKKGHVMKFCPNKVVKKYIPLADLKVMEIGDVYRSEIRDDRPCCEVKVGDQVMRGIVDTGAQVSILPRSIDMQSGPRKRFLLADGSSCLEVRGPKETKFIVDDIEVQFPVYTRAAKEAILGADLLKEYEATISMKDGVVTFGRKDVQPAVSKMDQQGCSVGPSLRSSAKLDTVVSDSIPHTSNEMLPDSLESSDKVCQMVTRNFSDLMSGLGKTEIVEHCIDTGNHVPITVQNRRIPVHFKDELAAHMKELLDDDIIEECESEWLFPMVIVRKKDGSIRMAIDFRLLNEATKKDTYPMPRIDETLEKVAGAKWFTKLDLRKGYYQVLLRESDRHKTAFAFEGKLYQFKRMPFGLTGAPQTFQRLMQKVLGHLPFVVCYLDDVLVFSESENDHLIHVKSVLDTLRTANLRLNAEKCKFGARKVDFLGFKIEDGTKAPTQDKTAIFRSFPTPTTTRQLKGFLGLANFVREMVPDFAVLSQPLWEASNKKKLVWSSECDASFEELKKRLASTPHVVLPDLRAPFFLATDASDEAMGAVLYQRVNGEVKVIEYMSKMFNQTQRRYSTIEKEATAIMKAVEKWRHLLVGRPFTVESDHKPLHWLLTKVDLPGKLGRMARKLREYDIQGIEWISGEENLLADTLSRIQVSLITSIPGSPFRRLEELLIRDPNRFRRVENRIWLEENGNSRLCIESQDEVNRILREVHEEVACHLGQFKCLEEVRRRFYWPGWRGDVKQHLRNCSSCDFKKDDVEPFREELVVQNCAEVFERVHIDICTDLMETDGFKHVVVLQDAFSKWLEVKPVKDLRATTIIDWLKEEVFSRFGEPDMIVSDEGSQFDSREFKTFCEDLSIVHRMASPYHHLTNGLVERGIQTLEKMLRTSCKEQSEWKAVLPRCVKAYNEMKHHTTGVSPYSLMFGRESRTKLDRLFQLKRTELDREMNMAIASNNRAVESKRFKTMYDRKCKKKADVMVDELVLWHVHEQGRGKSRKLNQRWQGPFRINAISGPRVTLVDRTGKKKTVHVNHLKRISYTTELGIFRGRGRPRNLIGRCGGGIATSRSMTR